MSMHRNIAFIICSYSLIHSFNHHHLLLHPLSHAYTDFVLCLRNADFNFEPNVAVLPPHPLPKQVQTEGKYCPTLIRVVDVVIFWCLYVIRRCSFHFWWCHSCLRTVPYVLVWLLVLCPERSKNDPIDEKCWYILFDDPFGATVTSSTVTCTAFTANDEAFGSNEAVLWHLLRSSFEGWANLQSHQANK